MQMVTVSVVKGFRHDGRIRKPGQTITISPVQAAIYAHQGVVSLARIANHPDPEPSNVEQRPPRQIRDRSLASEP
jgi:hypothetical protein